MLQQTSLSPEPSISNVPPQNAPASSVSPQNTSALSAPMLDVSALDVETQRNAPARKTRTFAPAMSQEEIDALLDTVYAEAAARKRRHRSLVGIWGGFAVLAGVGGVAYVINGALTGHWGGGLATNIWPSLTPLFTMGGIAAGLSQTHKKAVGQLAYLDDLRAVGPLTEVLNCGDSATVAQAEVALTRLLPRLQASDAMLLGKNQRDILNRALTNQPTVRRVELRVAILKAYEQVGDLSALGVVEKLAALEPKNDRQRTVQEAAAHCLPFLRDVAARNEAAHTLLRASASTAEARPDTLLRPAAPVAETAPETLLRAVHAEADASAFENAAPSRRGQGDR